MVTLQISLIYKSNYFYFQNTLIKTHEIHYHYKGWVNFDTFQQFKLSFKILKHKIK